MTEAQWPIGYGVGLRIKRSSVRIRPWPLRWVLGQGSLLPLSQGEAFTLASISYLAILVKYILAKKKKKKKMLERYSTPHGIRYFVYLPWVSPCWEQMLAIGAQANCIACNDTSVIVINFQKSKTHAITDTYCTTLYRKPMEPCKMQLCRHFIPTSPLNFFTRFSPEDPF